MLKRITGIIIICLLLISAGNILAKELLEYVRLKWSSDKSREVQYFDIKGKNLFLVRVISYYENGNKQEEVNYQDGLKHGIYLVWDEKGEQIEEWKYKKGQVIEFNLKDKAGKYKEVKKIMTEMLMAFINYLEDMEIASQADEVVEAINKLASSLQKIVPEIREMMKKYPELDSPEEPEELKEITGKLEKYLFNMQDKFSQKMERFRDNPEVKAAGDRLIQIMSSLDDPGDDSVESPVEKE